MGEQELNSLRVISERITDIESILARDEMVSCEFKARLLVKVNVLLDMVIKLESIE